jgi:hypothetical protein
MFHPTRFCTNLHVQINGKKYTHTHAWVYKIHKVTEILPTSMLLLTREEGETLIHVLDGPDSHVTDNKDMLTVATDYYKICLRMKED